MSHWSVAVSDMLLNSWTHTHTLLFSLTQSHRHYPASPNTHLCYRLTVQSEDKISFAAAKPLWADLSGANQDAVGVRGLSVGSCWRIFKSQAASLCIYVHVCVCVWNAERWHVDKCVAGVQWFPAVIMHGCPRSSAGPRAAATVRGGNVITPALPINIDLVVRF